MSSSAQERFAEALGGLGFSQYEARCYTGLLGVAPQTGYGLSKLTGVPQPKVYETLRKLVARKAAYELAGEPAKFVAVSPAQLFSDIKTTFEDRLDEAESYSRDLVGDDSTTGIEALIRVDKREFVIAAGIALLGSARRRVYVSASEAEIAALREALVATADRGVDIVVLSFAGNDIEHAGIRVFRHASTDGAVYRAHQAQHLAMVVDSGEALYGVAADGRNWLGVRTTSVPIIAVVKGYIRHDIDMQQVYADFGEELVAAYGPGLQRLESYRQDRSPRHESAGQDAVIERTG